MTQAEISEESTGPAEQEKPGRVVTPEELVKIISDTLDETIFQRSTAIYADASNLEDEYDPSLARRIMEDAKIACQQVKTIARIAKQGLNGEPIPTKILGSGDHIEEILDLSTSKHK